MRAKERKQSTDFKEAACCYSAVVQRAARRKNGFHQGSARGRPTAILTHPKRDRGQHYHAGAAVDCCRTHLLANTTETKVQVSYQFSIRLVRTILTLC